MMVHVDLTEIDGAIVEVDGLPRPQWETISHCVVQRFPDDQHDAWCSVVAQWLRKLGAALATQYRVVESEHFNLLSLAGDREVQGLLAHAERARETIRRLLPLAGVDKGPGKTVLLALGSTEHYYRYMSPFDPEGEWATSGGAFVPIGYLHIVLNAPDLMNATEALTHELAHWHVVDLPLPLWLNEGVAQLVENAVDGRPEPWVDSTRIQQHQRFWKQRGIEFFLSGTSFYDVEGQELSYELAYVVTRLLLVDRRKSFFHLLETARWEDHGAAAVKTALGCELVDLFRPFALPAANADDEVT